ncbi:DNA-damage-inducible protein [Lactobacillus acetotolerans]|jgi:DNA-damage-inducible protein J|uniref:DNA-damage-inducible protein n=1 Tax=Lactobacillus acetotolerans TaxID=1600 RepID=A0A0D6A3Y9_9LACO|nr:hypothetical protein [Lactobacillus acetotolerans]BAQ57155.1 DNA-damage-inducible protein [Lactobacillus acetotolerans]
MFYKLIVVNGELPFKANLTDGEKATLAFLKETKNTPITIFKNSQDVQNWLSEK